MSNPTVEERRGEASAGVALERQREAATIALQERPGFDVATLTDEEFTRGLDLIRRRQVRMQQILDSALIDGIHYGNPELPNGRTAFDKPMLLQAGAEELMKLFRLHPEHQRDPVVIATTEFVSVMVTILIRDSAGRQLTVRSASCNTLEKRFTKKGGTEKTFKDAREMLHQCLAMAEKRATTLAVRAATGATAFFAEEGEMEKALDARENQPKPMTDLEKQDIMRAAREAGITTRADLEAFAKDAIGQAGVTTKAEAMALLDALKARAKKRGKATPSDEELDQELAEQEAGT